MLKVPSACVVTTRRGFCPTACNRRTVAKGSASRVRESHSVPSTVNVFPGCCAINTGVPHKAESSRTICLVSIWFLSFDLHVRRAPRRVCYTKVEKNFPVSNSPLNATHKKRPDYTKITRFPYMRKGNMSFSCNLAVHGAVSTNLFHQVEIFH